MADMLDLDPKPEIVNPYLEDHGMLRSELESLAGVFRVDTHVFVLDDIQAILTGTAQRASNVQGANGKQATVTVETIAILLKGRPDPFPLVPQSETAEAVILRWTEARFDGVQVLVTGTETC